MKKLLFVLLFLSMATGMADQPIDLSPRHVQESGPITIDELVYSQSYDIMEIKDGYSINDYDDFWICDDFVLDGNYYVTEICIWMIWTGEQASSMNIVLSVDNTGDSDPNTTTDVWVENVPCTSTFTGDSWMGSDVYETNCIISMDAYPELDAGVHYYFEIQADVTDNCFILTTPHSVGDYCWMDYGNGVWVESEGTNYASDLFFDFYGEPVTALERETWGSIKTLF